LVRALVSLVAVALMLLPAGVCVCEYVRLATGESAHHDEPGDEHHDCPCCAEHHAADRALETASSVPAPDASAFGGVPAPVVASAYRSPVPAAVAHQARPPAYIAYRALLI
jgi:hypothetical protein